ncbi:Zinc-finger domain of monoamine-oxidase A repressor R1 [Dillenia turbinata]|uniref:Zinc-finger domain of monoamine-oxidase A repressor R1 n=1 Tax=Dillenia turbinata TaxID=194707 RepID=A0AAN8YUT3_9MAGN
MAISSSTSQMEIIGESRALGNLAQGKQNKSTRVRLVESRIYDSQNGKSCHQCRQKTMDVVAEYGENAEEVAGLEEWKCPKCRGICNCSLCMKKRGHQPTGILVNTAKASGFSSVSEMLHVKGFENVHYLKVKSASLKKLVGEKDGVALPNKRGKENFDWNDDISLSPSNVIGYKKHKRVKHEGLLENNGENIPSYDTDDGEELESRYLADAMFDGSAGAKKDVDEEIQLPKGTESTKVAGVDVPPDDVKHALEFLEFCSSFGEVLDPVLVLGEIKEERGSVLKDLFHGCGSKLVACMILHFDPCLNLLYGLSSSTSSSPKNTWLDALRECVSKSHYNWKDLPTDSLDRIDGYNELDSSKKIRVLTSVSYEVLGSSELRNSTGYSSERRQARREKLRASEEEHEASITDIQAEEANAHEDLLKASPMAPHSM